MMYNKLHRSVYSRLCVDEEAWFVKKSLNLRTYLESHSLMDSSASMLVSGNIYWILNRSKVQAFGPPLKPLSFI